MSHASEYNGQGDPLMAQRYQSPPLPGLQKGRLVPDFV